MRWFLAFVALALLCCSPRTVAKEPRTGAQLVADVVLHGDLDFTLPEREAVQRATQSLSVATAGAVRVRVLWDLDYRTLAGTETNLLLRVESWYPFVQASQPEGGVLLGATEPKSRSIFLVADTVAERGLDLTAVFLHELGHLLGVPHLDVPGALMRPAYSGTKCLSRVDLAALCAAVRCDADFTNPC